ncbi:MAG: helix-turn-helix domain-containing protein [Chloroflexi bacterium]|nr:helix-turn-helix domain-containing protein [Chloroflexota bacterium]
MSMLTVPQAAKRVRRNPETVRRWIREGRLPATKVGTQHIIEESDLDALGDLSGTLPLPPEWERTSWGSPMPDFLAILRRQREEH